MGQRHNRRRTRPRSRNRSRTLGNLLGATLFENQQCTPACTISDPVFLSPLAHTRHNWLGDCQGLESGGQPHHADELVMQQYRFFGGEPGDDTNLCYNMWDFFGRLDYIDT